MKVSGGPMLCWTPLICIKRTKQSSIYHLSCPTELHTGLSKWWEFVIPLIRLSNSVSEFATEIGEWKIKTKALNACCFSLPHNPVIQRHSWCMMGETSPTKSYKCMQHASLRHEQCPLSLASPHAAHAEKHAGNGKDRCFTVCTRSETEQRIDADDSHVWRIYSKLAMSRTMHF